MLIEINGKSADIDWPLSKSDLERIGLFIRANERCCRFLRPEDLSEDTGINETAAAHILQSLSKAGIVQRVYAIICPRCGKIADRGARSSEIRQSGYNCPWCGRRVEYEPGNLKKLYFL